MEKSALDITDTLRHQKQVLITSDIRYIKEMFAVKLCGKNIDSDFFYTLLPLHEDDTNFKEQLSYMNDKKTVKKLHDTSWKMFYFTSIDVSMLGYGCGVYQYPHFPPKIFGYVSGVTTSIFKFF